MIAFKLEKDKKILYFVYKGKITHEDYQKVVIPAVEENVGKDGPIHVFCDLRDMKSMELKAIWDDYKLGMRHLKDIDRFATVGDQWWVSFLMKVFQPFFRMKLKNFKSHQIDEAKKWINQKNK